MRILTTHEKENMITQLRNTKYNNKKTMIKGILFDSIAESERYLELLSMEKKGEIKELRIQPVFTLQVGFKRGKKIHKAITYIADFSYRKGSSIYIEDVKGVYTQVYLMKRKMLLKNLPNGVYFIETKNGRQKEY